MTNHTEREARREANRQAALAAFIHNANEIARMARELADIADDHFNMSPDEISWANAGDVEETCKNLRSILDRINGTGEYAKES